MLASARESYAAVIDELGRMLCGLGGLCGTEYAPECAEDEVNRDHLQTHWSFLPLA